MFSYLLNSYDFTASVGNKLSLLSKTDQRPLSGRRLLVLLDPGFEPRSFYYQRTKHVLQEPAFVSKLRTVYLSSLHCEESTKKSKNKYETLLSTDLHNK